MILSRTLRVLSTLSVFFHAVTLVSLQFVFWAVDARGQGQEKALITHSSESISIAPLTYGIEKGFYRREGVDLQFRILRGDLAISSWFREKKWTIYTGQERLFSPLCAGLQ